MESSNGHAVPKRVVCSVLIEQPIVDIKVPNGNTVSVSLLEFYQWIADNQKKPNYDELIRGYVCGLTGLTPEIVGSYTATVIHNCVIRAGDEYFRSLEEEKKTAGSTASSPQIIRESRQGTKNGHRKKRSRGSKTSRSAQPGGPST